ncbi:hypothetical protein [Arthrobacter zhaoguopingii]|uniref:hypothetical protein n=1 Tax=Arthrobacter zhaoguopingii TaxID=2681491 RepID=UPI00135A08C8|nr:hypothetical protein [Arthrobacter zhaoguopingii]
MPASDRWAAPRSSGRRIPWAADYTAARRKSNRFQVVVVAALIVILIGSTLAAGIGAF